MPRRQHEHLPRRQHEAAGDVGGQEDARTHPAARTLRAAARGVVARRRLRAAASAVRAWRSRELTAAQLAVAAWIIRREALDAAIEH